jgi:ParB-like chromosome segregation protein Spo0J
MTSELEFHPLADIFPMLDPKSLAELADDIVEQGQREPIIMLDGMILDGRNRYRACLMAGVEPTFEEFPDSGDPLAAVISANLRRRHLDESQRAMIAARLSNLKDGQRADQAASIEAPAISQSDAAEMLNVSRSAVQRAVEVNRGGAPELVTAVERGDVSVSAAAAVAALPKDEQKAIVAAGPAAVVKVAKAKRKQPQLTKYGMERKAEKAKAKAAKARLAEVRLGECARRTTSACGAIVYGDNSEAWLAAHPGATMKDFQRELPPRTAAQAEADLVAAHDLKTPPDVVTVPLQDNPVTAPEAVDDETPEQTDRRIFLSFAADTVEAARMTLEELAETQVKSGAYIREMLIATNGVFRAWERIRNRLEDLGAAAEGDADGAP